jgi:hypothetical protein
LACKAKSAIADFTKAIELNTKTKYIDAFLNRGAAKYSLTGILALVLGPYQSKALPADINPSSENRYIHCIRIAQSPAITFC